MDSARDAGRQARLELEGEADVDACVQDVMLLYGHHVGRALRAKFDNDSNWDLPSYAAIAQFRGSGVNPNTPFVILAFVGVDLSTILAREPVSSVAYMAMLHHQYAVHGEWLSLEERVRRDISRVHGEDTAHRVLEFWRRLRRDRDDLVSLAEILGLRYGMLTNIGMPVPYYLWHLRP